MVDSTTVMDRPVFLSGSIPDPERWAGEFHTLEITDAVVAAARAILTAGGVILTAAHPTVAPLLLYVASEFPHTDRPGVVLYQSRLFDDDELLHPAIRQFAALGAGEVHWTDAVPGDEPVPGRWNASLDLMRRAMFGNLQPVAAIFIGGMEGVRQEFDLFTDLFPGRPVYPVARPGGEAASLSVALPSDLDEALRVGDVYAAVFRRVMAHLVATLER